MSVFSEFFDLTLHLNMNINLFKGEFRSYTSCHALSMNALIIWALGHGRFLRNFLYNQIA